MLNSIFKLNLTGTPDPRIYTAYVDGEGGERQAEHSFEWRVDSVALGLDLGALGRAAVSGKPPEEDVHGRIGRQMYRAVFGGEVGELWQERRKQARRGRLSLVVSVDPVGARELMELPWEYLHDGRGFLSLQRRTPLSRLPWGLESEALGRVGEGLRLLVMISAPNGLREEEMINPYPSPYP